MCWNENFPSTFLLLSALFVFGAANKQLQKREVGLSKQWTRV
jgi:hypothetical protein